MGELLLLLVPVPEAPSLSLLLLQGDPGGQHLECLWAGGGRLETFL